LKNRPKIFSSLGDGFKTLSNHLYLLLFPLGLDLYFLFAPRYTISELANQTLDQALTLAQLTNQSADAIDQAVATFTSYFKYFSLSSALRTYPVGIPSLLSGRPLSENPFGPVQLYDMSHGGRIVLAILIFSLIGLILGTLYFFWSSKAAQPTAEKKPFKTIISAFLNLFILSLVMILAMFLISLPFALIFTLFNSLSPVLGLIAYFVTAMVLLSVIIPLYFAPHAIVVLDQSAFQAISSSLKMIRPFYSSASIFVTLEVIIAFLTNLLWQTPADNSPLLFVGIFGHALVTTVLLIASFHYFANIVKIYEEIFVVQKAT
ncbi:MAG TPA: hypothetical protein DCG78_01590, partial [Anaerolineaceae bacterium]|nr:hypothetical protein [Anaerolineaceae bacterium]